MRQLKELLLVAWSNFLRYTLKISLTTISKQLLIFDVFFINILIFISFSGQLSLIYPNYFYEKKTSNDTSNKDNTLEANDKSNKEDGLELVVPDLNISLRVRLKNENSNLLASNFIYFETLNNGSYEIPYLFEDTSCYFRSSKAAISFCNGIVSKLIN